MKVNKERLEKIQPMRFSYPTENGQELFYYAFFPSIEPKGCVVCIHGGGWTSDSAKRLFPQAAYFAEQGAVGISVEYRLNSETTEKDLTYCALLSADREENQAQLAKELFK